LFLPYLQGSYSAFALVTGDLTTEKKKERENPWHIRVCV
jgi:hypothetical protein